MALPLLHSLPAAPWLALVSLHGEAPILSVGNKGVTFWEAGAWVSAGVSVTDPCAGSQDLVGACLGRAGLDRHI